jgi:MFS family permease
MVDMADSRGGSEFRAHWPVLVAAFAGVAAGIAAMFLYSQGLFIKSLEAEFGWSRTNITLAFLSGSLCCALISPFAGALVDHYGPRAVGCGSLLALSLYFFMVGRFDGSIGWFVAVNIVMAALASGSSPVTFTRLVASHFVERRGLALGIVLCGTGFTGALLPVVIVPVIASEGWRAGYFFLALMVFVAVPVVWFFGRPTASAGIIATDVHAEGASLSFALRSRIFWLLLCAFASAALAIGGFVVHFIALLTDRGVTIERAGNLAAYIGIAVVIGRLATGFAIDRLPATFVAAAIFLIAALGCASLAYGSIAIAPLSALCIGLALGAEIDVASFLVVRHFGARNYGKIYGIIYGGLVAGITTSPALYALLFDQTGSYRPALLTSAAALTVSAALLCVTPRRPVEIEPASASTDLVKSKSGGDRVQFN